MSFGDGDLHIENEKLKERVDSLEVTNGKLCAEINRQERRIRQLEALVRAAWRCIHTGLSCSDCRLIAGGCTLRTAMRELGIEVN